MLFLLAFDWGLFSWIFWIAWGAAFLLYEIPAALFEKKHGTLPLTRVVRDRLMRKSRVVKFAVLLLLAWLPLHFLLSHDW